MNKILIPVAILIVMISIVGLIYSLLFPIVDPCVPSNNTIEASVGASREGVNPPSDDCQRQETTNWLGIGISIVVFASGVFLANYSVLAKKRKR